LALFFLLLLLIVFVLLILVRQVNQHERGVVLLMGLFSPFPSLRCCGR